MQDQLTQPTGRDESWLSLPLTLSPEAERLTGADYEPMLYVAAEQRYIRLSHGAARLLDALDGGTTTAQILARVNGGGDPVVEVRRRQTVLHTIDGLRRAGAFTLDRGGDTYAHPSRWRRWLARTPTVRITRGVDALVARPADLTVRHPRATRLALLGLAVASVALVVAGLSQFPGRLRVIWPVVVAVVLLEVAAHELAHAAVCRVFGVGVREAGIMLWGWFLPLAYVDCTDIYRVPAKRPRILVALAGPYVDLVAAGVCSLVALEGRGDLSGTAFVILLSLVLMLARNLTPLLPTDGYHALEAATGELNLRHRAWRQLRAWANDYRPRRQTNGGSETGPGGDFRPPTRRQRIYVAYAIVSAVYTVAMFAFVVVEIREIVRIFG
jgi:putative peptide zinc metalloprotease protein